MLCSLFSLSMNFRTSAGTLTLLVFLLVFSFSAAIKIYDLPYLKRYSILLIMASAQKEAKKTKEPVALERRRLIGYSIDSEQAELKKLEISDLDDVVSVMRKSAFEIGSAEKREIESVIKQGFSYGAYVDRMLVGVALAWPICFDDGRKQLSVCEQPNTIYIEDLAVLNAYEGMGIREKLVNVIEEEGSSRGLSFIVSIVGENPKEDDIISVVENRGTKAERMFLSKNYKFFKSGYGLAAYKRVSP
ncbi:MAG: GNAT family N-acetyltransferase [Methanobacteriota archaeon]|nr:MAG: GNAT family N-acetyltransferase [Euryarchaeota archaeon]